MNTRIEGALLQMMAQIQKNQGTGRDSMPKFNAGQIMDALVLWHDGDEYLLLGPNGTFAAKSQAPLVSGQTVRLLVLEVSEETVVLKLDPAPEENAAAHKPPEATVKETARKYGVLNEKALLQVTLEAARIPADEQTAVRYLLDPHLLLGLLIPGLPEGRRYDRVEIYGYKGQDRKQKIYEVRIALDMEMLGRIEILMRLVDNGMYALIRAESAETKGILEANRDKLMAICPHTGIIAKGDGPLFGQTPHWDIDIRI